MTKPPKELVRIGAIYGTSLVARFSSWVKHCPHGFENLYRVQDFDPSTKRGVAVRLDLKTLQDSPEPGETHHVTRHNSTTPVWVVTVTTRTWQGGEQVSEDKQKAQRWMPRWPFSADGEPWMHTSSMPLDREGALGQLRDWERRVNLYFDQLERGHP